jgi:hypothetical protein
VPQESQPGWTAGIVIWSVMVGQDAPNDIFIQRNTESQSDLLGDSGATPFGIPPFGIDNGIDEFFRRSLWDPVFVCVLAQKGLGTFDFGGRCEDSTGWKVSER